MFMLCFSKDQDDNSNDCVKNWIMEISNNEPGKPIVVILTNKDLDDDQFTLERLEKIQRKYDLQIVCETSSRDDQSSVDAAFD